MADSISMHPPATVIVLVWNGARFLPACLDALLAQQGAACEIIVVDNHSTDDSVALAEKYAPRVRVICNDANLGYAAGNNMGLRAATGEIVVLLNQDTVVQSDWLSVLLTTFDDPTIGVVGCKALLPDGRRLQHAGGVIGADDALARHRGWGEQDHGQYDALMDVDYVTGAAMGARREIMTRLGGLDEDFFPAFYEEVDFCYRARRAGWRIVYQPRAVLIHHETTSIPSHLERTLAYQRNRVRFVLRHWDMTALEKFFAAERAVIQVSGVLDDMVAAAQAYWANMLATPFIVARRSVDATLGGALTRTDQRRIVTELSVLRRMARQRIAALVMMHAALAQQNITAPEYLPVRALPETLDLAGLYTHIENLESQTLLQLPRLQSSLPVLGRVINAVFNTWILPLMRQYYEPLLRQQSVFNLRTFRALATLMRATDALSRLEQLDGVDQARIVETLAQMDVSVLEPMVGGHARTTRD